MQVSFGHRQSPGSGKMKDITFIFVAQKLETEVRQRANVCWNYYTCKGHKVPAKEFVFISVKIFLLQLYINVCVAI